MRTNRLASSLRARGIAPSIRNQLEGSDILGGYSDSTTLVLMTKHAIKSLIY